MAVNVAQAMALRAVRAPSRAFGPSCRPSRSGGTKNRVRGEGGGRGLFRGLGRGLVWTLGLAAGLGFFVLVSVGLLFGFRWVEGNDALALRQVEVRGASRLTAEEVVTLAGVEQGGGILDVSMREVEQRLSAYPWVESVTVRRELPDTLRITVQEKAPSWWLATEQGLFYADAAGEPIAPVAADRLVSLPVLEVEPGAEDLAPGLAADLAGLARLDSDFGLARAAWIRVGLTELSMYFDAADVMLTLERGNGEPWALSLARLAAVWADLKQRGENEGVRYVTVKGGKAWAGAVAKG